MQPTIQINVNGEPKSIESPTTLRELIEQLGLGRAAVAAEVNKTLIPRRDHETTNLGEGDAVELVTLVGGG